jgi:lysophospholipase L1-like esterase
VTKPAVKWALPALGLLCCPAVPAQATAYVLGDSLGVGVAEVAHVKGLARISVHIRGPKALAQLAQTPAGSTVFLVLGTNDANGSIARLDKSIEDIVREAEKKNITLVWIGPPCVRKSWDTRARELDGILREKLADTSVRYVSMRDDQMCSGALHEPDGVHLKTKGYMHMWQKARAATGIEVASADSTSDVTGTALSRAAGKKVERIPLPVPRRPMAGGAR